MSARDDFPFLVIIERCRSVGLELRASKATAALDELDRRAAEITRLTSERDDVIDDALLDQEGGIREQVRAEHDALRAEVARLTEANTALQGEVEAALYEANVMNEDARSVREVNGRLIEALRELADWDVLTVNAQGYGSACDDAPWARKLIADALAGAASPVPDAEPPTPVEFWEGRSMTFAEWKRTEGSFVAPELQTWHYNVYCAEHPVEAPVPDAERCKTCDGAEWIVVGQSLSWPYGEQRQCPDCAGAVQVTTPAPERPTP